MSVALAQKVLREMSETQEVIREMSETIDGIKESKERLRIALVNKGFGIPKGLKLEEWIPYVERGCNHERTISD